MWAKFLSGHLWPAWALACLEQSYDLGWTTQKLMIQPAWLQTISEGDNELCVCIHGIDVGYCCAALAKFRLVDETL